VNIGIVGAGNIGATLGSVWRRAGHRVIHGVRSGSKGLGTSLIGDAPSRGPEQAVIMSDVVLIAVPGSAVEEVLSNLGASLAGKVVIDATNRIGTAPMHSLGVYARLARDAFVFRAFNTLGWEVFTDPFFSGARADHFYCGPTGERAETVEALIKDVGLRPIRLGDLDRADLLDGLTRIYFALATERGYGRHIAFTLLSDRETNDP
jgi:8-hydroxy-5-deazaflavin:NADPH oxidoreductase